MLAALWTDQACVDIDPWAHPSVSNESIKRARAAYPSDDEDDDVPIVASLKRLKPPPRPAPLIHVARSHAAALQLVSPPTKSVDPVLLATAVDDGVVLHGDVQDLSRLVEQQTGIELPLDATLPRLLPVPDGKEEAASVMATQLSHVPARINVGVSVSVPMPRARSRVVPIGWDD